MPDPTVHPLPGKIVSILGLSGWSAILFYLQSNNGLTVFLHPSFRLPVILSAWILLVMTLALVVFLLPKKSEPVCCAHGHSHEQTHHHQGLATPIWKLLILLLPALAALLLQPNHYSTEVLKRRGIAKSPPMQPLDAYVLPTRDQAALTETEPTPQRPQSLENYLGYWQKTKDGGWLLEITDLLFLMDDPELRSLIQKEKVEVIAQRMPCPSPSPDPTVARVNLYRLIMSCCAADARPYSILAEFPNGLPKGRDAEWLKVKGHMTYILEEGQYKNILVVESVEKIKEPKDPYLY
jgi:uncharacterized repeat protein (TIGR03943 family)